MNTLTYFQNLCKDLEGLYPEEEAKAIAYWIFEDVLLIKRAHLKLIEKELDLGEELKLEQIKNRLLKGEPIQYILGYAWFRDLVFKVNSAVLIPRPETEELVAWVLEEQATQDSFLDIGTGSGCIAVSLKNVFKQATVFALDVSPEALEVANENAKQNVCKIQFLLGSILEKETQLNVQLLNAKVWVSNPPYIAEEEKASMHKNVLDFEPHLALFVGAADPLLFYKTITQAFLGSTQTHTLYFELSEFYTEALENWLPQTQLKYRLKKDAQGKTRMLKLEK
ncbi:MAG: peptide chain release factor N(5)-glutamine methyltransferase [Bacteroidetes bacterium]|nr:peptide chain release factor N(5)-glutamine methyltransferase [Bacteroidota bacterium]